VLTLEDIEFMKQTRREIVSNRQSKIILIYSDGGEVDPITGEVLEPNEVPFETTAVVTEISSLVKVDKRLESGLEVEKGDIWFSVDIDTLEGIYESIKRVTYGGKDYEVVAKDKKGIGERNRAEFVGRLVI
jgi:hypothetical protein